MIRAVARGTFHVHEALAVGPARLLGEVIQLNGDEIVAQVYEDTTGLAPGAVVTGRGLPLSVRLGPGLLGRIFDGLLRPLAPDPAGADRGRFRFEPRARIGDALAPGQAFGVVDVGGRSEPCIVPPPYAGRLAELEPAGEYDERAVIGALIDAGGVRRPLAIAGDWPVRVPRPVARRLPPVGPLITGQRILDTLFPVARGGRAALPGGFGTGKTILQEALAKWCDADVIVYVGCGERGNEMAEVLDEFPRLDDPRTGRRLMERAVIIANTSNMPVAAREASIYTAVTVAEYFRDQGRHVALLADSTSRWAEALREVSGRLGELPGEAGYPAYLSARLAEFYERAARVETLAGTEGSLTIIGAISPAGRRLLRARDAAHAPLRALVLGARPGARAGAVLPGDPPAAVVHRGRAAARGVVAVARQQRLGQAPRAAARAARAPGAARTHGADRRPRRAAAGAAARARACRHRQRGAAPAVLVLRGRPLLFAGTAVGAGAPRGRLHRARRARGRRRRRAGDRGVAALGART